MKRTQKASSGISRLEFLQAAGVGAVLVGVGDAVAGQSEGQGSGIVDVNVWLSRWPLRRIRGDRPEELVSVLREGGVEQAWVASLEGLWHKDIAGVNARLAEECRRYGAGLLVPFGSINPMWPDWEEDLRRCAQDYRMAGIRLHPNYHGYGLSDGRLKRVLEEAAELGLIVQLPILMEDERMMHPLFRVPAVEVNGLADLISEIPKLRLVLLNGIRGLRGPALKRLLEAGQVYVEISHLEGVGGIERLLEEAPLERVVFGSHAPFFYLESALLKLRESRLRDDQVAAIRYRTARGLWG